MDRGAIIDAIVAAVQRCNMLPGFSSSRVSKNRWGSMHLALAGQCAGFLVHNLAGAVVGMTYRRWEDGDAEGVDDDDMRLVLRKKAYRTRMYVESEERRRRAVVTLFTSTPLDHLWRQAQYLEEAGAILLDMHIARLNPCIEAEVGMCALARGDVREVSSPVSPIFWQFAPSDDSDAHVQLLRECRHNILHRSAHLHFRVTLPLLQWPYKLATLVDERLGWGERERIAQELMDTPLCCLDPQFTRKVHHFPRLPDPSPDPSRCNVVRLVISSVCHVRSCVLLYACVSVL